MRLGITLCLSLGFLAVANTQDDVVKDEMKQLQGTWVRICAEVDGQKKEDDNKEPGKAIKLTIKGDKFGVGS